MIAFVANDAAGYEVFMGRWTSRLAGRFWNLPVSVGVSESSM
jgi:hypothetical protein